MTSKLGAFVRAQPAALQFALLETGAATDDGGKIRFSKAVTALHGMDCQPLGLDTAHSMESLRMIVLDDGTYAVVARWHGAHMRWELEFQADDCHIDNPLGLYAITHWAETTLPMHIQRNTGALAEEYARVCSREAA